MPALDGAPAWVLAIAVTLYLVFAFVRWLLDWQAKKAAAEREEEAKRKRELERTHLLQAYERKLKDSRPEMVPPLPPLDEQTGKHDLRALFAERDRDDVARETLALAQQNADTMARLSRAIEGQGVLMEKLVGAVEQEQRSHDAIIGTLSEVGRAVVVLTRRVDQHEQDFHAHG